MIGPTDDLIASMSEKYDLNSWFVNVSLKFFCIQSCALIRTIDYFHFALRLVKVLKFEIHLHGVSVC